MATDGNQTYVLFVYRNPLWKNNDTVISFIAGDGVHSFNLSLSQTDSIFHFSNIGVPGAYIFRTDQETIMQPPIIIGKN